MDVAQIKKGELSEMKSDNKVILLLRSNVNSLLVVKPHSYHEFQRTQYISGLNCHTYIKNRGKFIIEYNARKIQN